MPRPNKPGTLNKKYGGVSTKWWVMGGIATGSVAYLYYKHSSSSSSSTTDPTTTTAADPNAVADPTADPNAGAQYDPYVGYDSSYGSGYGGAYGAYGGGALPGSPSSDPILDQAAVDEAAALGTLASNSAASNPETNKQWMHHAIAALEKHGYTKAAATAAITAYLTGAPLTTKQLHTVETATGLVGPPPHNAPGIHHQPTPKVPKKRVPKKTVKILPHHRHRSTTVVHHVM